MSYAVNTASATLSWYFTHGITAFSRSTTGPMWERAANLYARGKSGPDTMPVRETKDYRRDMVAEDTWVKIGGIKKRLDAIAALDPQAARCLAAVYGHEGAKWSYERWRYVRPRGSIVAAFVLVPSGQALLSRSRRYETCRFCGHARCQHGERVEENKRHVSCHEACACSGFSAMHHMSDTEVLRSEVRADDLNQGRDALRRQLIVRAEREAGELLERALRMWVNGGER